MILAILDHRTKEAWVGSAQDLCMLKLEHCRFTVREHTFSKTPLLFGLPLRVAGEREWARLQLRFGADEMVEAVQL